MGTAGPLALARALLDDGSGKPFFVLNRYDGGWGGMRTLCRNQMGQQKLGCTPHGTAQYCTVQYGTAQHIAPYRMARVGRVDRLLATPDLQGNLLNS